MSKIWERVEPEDPRRCQANAAQGQCPFKAVDGSQYCPRHGANKQTELKAEASRRLYTLSKWQVQLEQAASNPNIKSLRDEIGILRIIVQEKINSCADNNDLVMISGSLGELLLKVTKTVQACHRIEKELGQLLDKSQATALAQQFVAVIGKYVEDPDILQFISEDLLAVVNNMDQLPSDEKPS